ncbi:chemokine-like protein TAFA-1 isoform X1 [Nothobranchius furzeri]|uniref:chemokine-like protein TAFA-1 isoform X1 n=1 Tax=Nothobranchius furzeri TaxID=105023 RepID=UPI00077D3302|nr:chemokine-like protein TAFA-1 isoform X1 [Nothobranchius furzeri]
MLLLRLVWVLTAAAVCFLILLLHNHILKEGHLLAGTCEIVTLARDSSQPRRTIARQTARCACRKGQIAGTTRARPACVDGLLTVLAKTNTPHKRMIPIIHHPSFLGGNAAATPSVDNQSAATIRAVGRSNSASGFMLG